MPKQQQYLAAAILSAIASGLLFWQLPPAFSFIHVLLFFGIGLVFRYAVLFMRA